MQLLMKIGANARYFTDASTKIALDVEAGEAAAGMTIDFYGRFQSEAVRKPDGSSRLQYVECRRAARRSASIRSACFAARRMPMSRRSSSPS